MTVITGNVYFVSIDFFDYISDPYLKINYENTKRPHYFALKDEKTLLYWLVPCSSKVEKFENIIEKKKAQNKPTDTIKIVKLQGRKTALLFQDMFPVSEKYISEQYIRGGQPVCITDPKQITELTKTAFKIINMLRRGIRFTPTQPDVLRIEKIVLDEINVNITK